MRRRWILVAGVVVALLVASVTVGILAFQPLQRVDVTIASPTQVVVDRPATWNFQIHNLGPGIGHLGLRLSGRNGWLENHTVVYVTSGCQIPSQGDLLLCGPVLQGETKNVSVIAKAQTPGSYSYQTTFCDCSNTSQVDLAGPDAPRVAMPGSRPAPYVETWSERVLSGPGASVTVTDIYGNAVSGAAISVRGTSISTTTSSTGVARINLGPLGPGTYSVDIARTGLISGSIELTVPAQGDAPAAALVMASSAAALQPNSNPAVLPSGVLIADEDNNRLVEVSPLGQLLWIFPRPGDLAPGQTFLRPDDAFFSPDGTQIIATQEEDFAVSVIDVVTHKIVWRYGQPGVPGSGPNQLWNPDDAMLLNNGDVLIADIVNCRIITVAKSTHTIVKSYGQPGACHHNPPSRFGSPNGAFPLDDGNWLVTEINGDWVSEIAPGGAVQWSVHPPSISYPSDTNQMGPDRYVTVDYSYPGQVVIFDRAGNTIWRYRPTGAAALDHPSLAIGLPNGDILLNDDYNHRVMVVDPKTDQVVWQYGATGHPGTALGLINHPDGVDLAPPYSLLGSHASTLQGL